MPKPFWFQGAIRNFVGSGTIEGASQTRFDRRVDWVTRVPALPPEDFVYSFCLDSDSSEIFPETEATDVDAVVWIALYPWYPFLHDYKELLDDDLFTDGLTLETPSKLRGLYPADSRTRPEFDDLISDASLEITGALTLRCGVKITAQPTASNVFIGYTGIFSASESENHLYLFRATDVSDVSRLSFESENGAGISNLARWENPMGRWILGKSYIAELRKSSGDVVRMYINGQLLAWVRSTTNVTDNGDGTVSDFEATGGTNSELTLGDDTDPDEVNPYFWAVYDVEKTNATSYAAGRIANTLQAYQPDSAYHSTLNVESNTILCLSAADGSLDDLAGNLTGWTGGRTPSEQELIVGSSWIIGDGQGSTADPEYQELSDLVIRVKCRVGDTTPTLNAVIASCGANGEDPAENTVWQLYWPTSSTLGYFHEEGSGANHNAIFDLPSSLVYGQLLYVVCRRTDNGSDCDIEMWCQQDPEGTFAQMTLSSTTGTDNGDETATITNPDGGGDGVLGVLNFPDLSQEWTDSMIDVIHVKNATTTDGAESAVAALLMPTT